MKTYALPVNIEPDEGDSWFAEIPLLPGCALSCYPREHVLESLQETAQAMLEVMAECGDQLPKGIKLYEGRPGDKVAPGLEVVAVRVLSKHGGGDS